MLTECIASEVVAIPLLCMTRAHATCDWALVLSLSIFGVSSCAAQPQPPGCARHASRQHGVRCTNPARMCGVSTRPECDQLCVLPLLQAVGAPIGAAMLTHLPPRQVEFAVGCLMLLVILLNCLRKKAAPFSSHEQDG